MVEKVGVEACQLTCVAALYKRDVGRPGRCAAGDGEGAVIRHGERTAGIRAVKRRAAKSLGDGADRADERHAGDLRHPLIVIVDIDGAAVVGPARGAAAASAVGGERSRVTRKSTS